MTNQPLVIDTGSGICKAGFAGQDVPSLYFPSIVGRPKHLKIMQGALNNDHLVGKQAVEHRGLLSLKHPMAHGIVTNWFDMELIFNHVYSELNCLSEQHPVLLTQAPLNSKKNRDVSAQLFFETYNVPALFFSVQAVLALYASGKTTGIVLDIGDGVSHSVPVYQGFAVSHAIQRLDLAGRNITSHLQLLLRKSGYCLDTSAEFDIVRQIKEKSCYLSSNPQKEEQDFQKDSYILPDGNIIKLGSERFLAPEILFQPHLIGCEHLGVHQLLVDCINRVDMDIRKSMFTNIVLSGGTTLTKGICSNLGFGDRLLKETKKLAQRDIKIKIHAPPERTYSTWVGGSILASLSTFKKMWVSAQEYQEDPDIINKRFGI